MLLILNSKWILFRNVEGMLEKLFWYLDQSYFDIRKRSISENSNIIILFKQTLKDVEHIYSVSLCREAWKDVF